MGKLLAIALGGAMGSIARYAIAVGTERLGQFHFPWGTLVANLVGCLLIGLCWGLFEKVHISNEFRLFLFTGFLGGFTTFSTFARETVQLLKAGDMLHAMTYLLFSNLLGIGLVFLGLFFSTRLLRL